MPTTWSTFLLVLTVLLVLSPTKTYAFGAGDIPDFAYLNGKAFRHGDIENILENLVKHVGGPAMGGGLLGFATSMIKVASGGSKFSKMDVKRVYFGNWLRDYSQAMDIAGLSKLAPDTITLIISVLGFMTFGFATQEFEVTQERLGVYLPVEHIDNPKGYGEQEGDARRIHPKLRPPINPEELEIDERTGMKKYMASENQGWDTSTAFIRRTIKACIDHGRRAGGEENADLFEAFRLMGTGLHTLEDLLAHSNWCEIALRKMGHKEVFCHVGDNVIIQTPNGPAPPIVTGTFGGADFLHSLLGEAGDHLSQASVTDLTSKMNEASQGGDSNLNAFQAVLSKLPIGGGDDKKNQSQEMQKQSKAYHFDPNNIAPLEVQRNLLDLLKWRDSIMRDVTEGIEMVPGLSDLIDEFTNALNAYVYTVLAPYLVPMITSVTGVLNEGSAAVINQEDQYQVFDNPDASDPSHSILSKDHFALILNEPAGKIAQVVDEHTVGLIVRAWSDNSNPDDVIDAILEAFHHPYYASGRSQIQNKMFEEMKMWFNGLDTDEAQQVLERLTKQSVRDHNNKRIGSEDMNFEEPGYGRPQGSSQGSQGNIHSSSGGQSQYGQGNQSGGGRRYNNDESQLYGGNSRQGQTSYGGDGYGQQEYNSRRHGEIGYGREGGYQEPHQYYNTGDDQKSSNAGYQGSEGSGARRRDDGESRYGESYSQDREYGRQPEHGRSDEYSRRGNEGYTPSYGQGDNRSRHRDDDGSYGRGESYGESYGGDNEGSGRRDRYTSGDGEGYGRSDRYAGGNDEGYNRSGRYTSGDGEGYGRSDRYTSGDNQRHAGGDGEGYGRSDRYTSGDGERYGRQDTSASEGFEGGEGYGRRGGHEEYSNRNRSEEYAGGSGYNPNYGRDETFGAERLNIRDDGEDSSERKHHGHRHHRKHSDDD